MMTSKIIFKFYFLFIVGFFLPLSGQVGINTSSPQATLDVVGKSNASSTKSFKVRNSSDVESITVTDDAKVGIRVTNPQANLHILSDVNGSINERAGGAGPAFFALRKNESTDRSINQALVSGANIGAITFVGNTGNGYTGTSLNSSRIMAVATQNFTTTAQGTRIEFYTTPNDTNSSVLRMTIGQDGKIGIGRSAITNILEIEGEASKTTTGAWLANSDGRLKKDIKQISGNEALEKLLRLKGVYYYWNDDKTGILRPKEKQMGFIAQNIQEVFPDKVTQDAKGYLQTAYGDYDAVLVEAIRALHQKNENLEKRINELESKINGLTKK
ncbi:hypothetical protein B0A69_04115 [Chryseobacterium shigense]|uniref:Chaperone of endosialidase n=1 Tax=Chryseobacterium shigense TaxID=297244 RepID=A0A1N7IR99_9FLAO|nr:tail fiber domain-containing protein [Chryseobacterium shigense]PQA95574.1 hypothetical protein B0A69_04115 [Chryseobacterium shigense]SIS39625.1 Chaperone of endosialidase [Chryseobacterium shigense]